MSNQWDRNPAINNDRLNASHNTSIDDEIERLQSRPGFLERLFKRVSDSVRRGDEPTRAELVRRAGHSLPEADFTRQRLSRADFRASILHGSIFTGAFLDGALFCDADMREANLAEAILRGADLRGADLRGGNLIGADFSGADLRGTNLRGAYLWGADFNDANLQDALLDGAYAGGSIFSNARNLTIEQFRSTIHDETGAYRLSMLPESFTSKPKR